MINELLKYKAFLTFDLRSAYHQIKLTPSDHKYTEFEANGKYFEFTRIPFGVKNGVAKFHCKMCDFIEKENRMGAFSYLDNITVAGHDQAKHDRNVNSVLKAILRRGFTLNDNIAISSVKHITF